MKQYLLYGQVQRRLDERMERVGEPYSFYDALAELWREKEYHSAPALPAPSFEEWEVSDIDAFSRIMDSAPVDLDMFRHQLRSEVSGAEASRRIHKLDVLPMKVARNESSGSHRHESFEMLYAMRGSARLFLDNTSRNLAEGELCLIAPHFTHDVRVDDISCVASITFSEHTIENTLYRLLGGENTISDFFRTSLNRGQRGYLILKMPPNEQTLRVIRSIFHEGYSGQEYAREICSSYIEILFSYVLRGYAENCERFTEERGDNGVPLLAVLKYIQSNYKTASLREIAERFHYEPNYLGKYIKWHTGKNYTEIIAGLRMEEAKRLLRNTEASIAEISELTGFRSGVHFTRSFKKYAGLPPSEYRKARKGTDNIAQD